MHKQRLSDSEKCHKENIITADKEEFGSFEDIVGGEI